MLDKARVAIQTCIQTLISNIEQDNSAEPATQQGTMGAEEEGDDEILLFGMMGRSSDVGR
ncbi:hypothetical protein B0H16DRAFT_1727678 [Mycena metata]|uniref:Uncharacterized protein n=1 Tax=Mycena metata TaxID=1033252 RepID=A0AAD7II27_9AGAR|nr:hypothetical protein B0H16DRAFT_1727678 [Mycena metata]